MHIDYFACLLLHFVGGFETLREVKGRPGVWLWGMPHINPKPLKVKRQLNLSPQTSCPKIEVSQRAFQKDCLTGPTKTRFLTRGLDFRSFS